MEAKAKRTLVKSQPELWALASDPDRMREWAAAVAGTGAPVAIEVTDRDPERSLAWRAAADGAVAAIEIQLADAGFGTAVEITAHHQQPDPNRAIAALEALLDELGAPERRPFAGG